MSKKNPDSGMTTNFKNGQSNEYIYHSDDRHEHYWYNTKTGMMGGHGENASAADKKWCGQLSNDMKIGNGK